MRPGVLSVRHLGYAYPEQPVFADWSAEIGPGVTWIVGDECSGKTTLMRLLAGELHGSGTISFADAASRPAWHDLRDERHDALGVRDFFDRVRAERPAFDAAALARHVAGFALEPHLGKSLDQLSTGSRRKVGLAASLAAGAAVTLLDDPGAALDAGSVAHLMRTLAEADADASRAWLVTAYEAPRGWPNAKVIGLPGRV